MNDTHTLSCRPEKGAGLGLVSIARGALHPHLLAHRRRWKKMASQTGQPLSLLCFLCSRFTVGSNESHQQLFRLQHCSPLVMQGGGWWSDGRKGGGGGRREGGDRVWCMFMWSQSVFSLCSWQILHLSVSASSICPSVSFSLVAPRMKRTWGEEQLYLGSVLLQRAVLRSVHPSFTCLCWRWASAWWPTLLSCCCCTNPGGVCRDQGSAHL